MTFDEFFQRLSHCRPHVWQARLAVDDACKDRLIGIPTGFGKTAGVTIAWLWNRVHRNNDAWPRRLVLCPPMRTLVEQTEHALLNVDCLWVMDEIQLMDVGLATSAQLQGFARRDERDRKLPRPRRTWWMSATLQRAWLHRAPDLANTRVFRGVMPRPRDAAASLKPPEDHPSPHHNRRFPRCDVVAPAIDTPFLCC